MGSCCPSFIFKIVTVFLRKGDFLRDSPNCLFILWRTACALCSLPTAIRNASPLKNAANASAVGCPLERRCFIDFCIQSQSHYSSPLEERNFDRARRPVGVQLLIATAQAWILPSTGPRPKR